MILVINEIRLEVLSPEKEIYELNRLAEEWDRKMNNATRSERKSLMKERLVEVGCCNPDSDIADKLAEALVEIWEKQNSEEDCYGTT